MEGSSQPELDPEEFDDPRILEDIILNTADPRTDPSEQHDTMVYNLLHEGATRQPRQADHGPLPESSFIAAHRESIPHGRVTTAMSRGRGSGRGRGEGEKKRMHRKLVLPGPGKEEPKETKEQEREQMHMEKKM